MADRVNNNSCKHNDAWLQTFQPYIYMKKHKILTFSRKHNPILIFFALSVNPDLRIRLAVSIRHADSVAADAARSDIHQHIQS